MDDSKEIGEKARVSDTEEVELNDNMETEGLRYDMGMENDSQDTCEECQNVEKCSSNNVSPNKLTDDKHTIDSNGEQNSLSTVINEIGQKFVIFDDELVMEGSKKWEMSACGYFVGYRMSMQELTSRVGKPLIMDAMTTKMCNEGLGSLRYARILIEANATKGLVDFMEILYLNKQNGEHYDKSKDVENEGTYIELDENDVYIEKEGIAKFRTENEVRGESSNLFQ
ncbi:hypothetical protein Tco_0043156 [Tanacetum coccineum]